MATNFEKIVLNKQIEILDDEEVLDSICSVTNELQKIEHAGGEHGDYFDAIGLALLGLSQGELTSKENRKIRTGSPSVFSKDRPPKGW